MRKFIINLGSNKGDICDKSSRQISCLYYVFKLRIVDTLERYFSRVEGK